MQTTLCKLKFFIINLEGLECYKNTHRKSDDITKVTDKKKIDNVQYRNIKYRLLLCWLYGAAGRRHQALPHRPYTPRHSKTNLP